MSVIPAAHVHITEREGDGTWEDCTWCSGLEWFRLVYDASKPATHAEAEALRAASGKGPTGGSNLTDLAKGIAARYHVTVPARVDNNTLPQPGQVAVVQGSMKAFGPTNPLSKWDPGFDGGHAVCVMNIGGIFYWCDPEAPTGAAVPVVISKADLLAFINAFAGQSLIGNIKVAAPPVQEADMLPLTTSLLGSKFTIKAQSNIRVEPRIAAAKVRSTVATEVALNGVGTVKGDVDPANGSDVWYAWVENGQWRFTAKDNVTSVSSPSAAPSYPDLSTQLAASQAKVVEQATIIANQKTALTAAAALKARSDAAIDALKG